MKFFAISKKISNKNTIVKYKFGIGAMYVLYLRAFRSFSAQEPGGLVDGQHKKRELAQH
jgi:hypothetical protein